MKCFGRGGRNTSFRDFKCPPTQRHTVGYSNKIIFELGIKLGADIAIVLGTAYVTYSTRKLLCLAANKNSGSGALMYDVNYGGVHNMLQSIADTCNLHVILA